MKMKFACITLLILLCLSCKNDKSSEEYHHEANILEQAEKYPEAILLLDTAIMKDPHNVKALLDRAVDKSLIENYNAAIMDYSLVIRLDPDNTLAFLNRGKNKKRIQNYIGALKDFNRAISLKGGETLYIDKIENTYIDNGFEFDVGMEEIRYERGLVYYELDSLKKAFDDFSFSIGQNYSLSESYYWRGIIYLRFDMKPEACSDLYNARDLGDPDAQKLIDENCLK